MKSFKPSRIPSKEFFASSFPGATLVIGIILILTPWLAQTPLDFEDNEFLHEFSETRARNIMFQISNLGNRIASEDHFKQAIHLIKNTIFVGINNPNTSFQHHIDTQSDDFNLDTTLWDSNCHPKTRALDLCIYTKEFANKQSYVAVSESHHSDEFFMNGFLQPHLIFTNSYTNMVNFAVRFGTRSLKETAKKAILINTHFDTAPGSPGAADDGAGTSVFLEMTRLFAHKLEYDPEFYLKYDVIFLFNGAEETLLQGAHGFVEQHPWYQNVEIVLNFEASGTTGADILFQYQNPDIVYYYSSVVGRPHSSSMAPDLFSTGIIPSDTDYRIFRDFSNVSSLIDFAVYGNGYFYHTDRDVDVSSGTLNHMGKNTLDFLSGLLLAQSFQEADNHPSDDMFHKLMKQDDTSISFFDIFGRFLVILHRKTVFLIAFSLLSISLYLSRKRLQVILRLAFAFGIACIFAPIPSLLLSLLLSNPLYDLSGFKWFGFHLYAFCLYGLPTVMYLLFALPYCIRTVENSFREKQKMMKKKNSDQFGNNKSPENNKSSENKSANATTPSFDLTEISLAFTILNSFVTILLINLGSSIFPCLWSCIFFLQVLLETIDPLLYTTIRVDLGFHHDTPTLNSPSYSLQNWIYFRYVANYLPKAFVTAIWAQTMFGIINVFLPICGRVGANVPAEQLVALIMSSCIVWPFCLNYCQPIGMMAKNQLGSTLSKRITDKSQKNAFAQNIVMILVLFVLFCGILIYGFFLPNHTDSSPFRLLSQQVTIYPPLILKETTSSKLNLLEQKDDIDPLFFPLVGEMSPVGLQAQLGLIHETMISFLRPEYQKEENSVVKFFAEAETPHGVLEFGSFDYLQAHIWDAFYPLSVFINSYGIHHPLSHWDSSKIKMTIEPLSFNVGCTRMDRQLVLNQHPELYIKPTTSMLHYCEFNVETTYRWLVMRIDPIASEHLVGWSLGDGHPDGLRIPDNPTHGDFLFVRHISGTQDTRWKFMLVFDSQVPHSAYINFGMSHFTHGSLFQDLNSKLPSSCYNLGFQTMLQQIVLEFV